MWAGAIPSRARACVRNGRKGGYKGILTGRLYRRRGRDHRLCMITRGRCSGSSVRSLSAIGFVPVMRTVPTGCVPVVCVLVVADDDWCGRWCRMGASGPFISQGQCTRAGVISRSFLILGVGLLMYVTGVVAGNKKIPKGSYIGIYAGELLTEQEGEARGRYVRCWQGPRVC